MRRETEEFLKLVRDAEDPTRADEARVQRALRVAIAAGVAPSVAAHGRPEGTWLGDALHELGLSGAKLNLIAAGAALSLATGDAALPPRAADSGGGVLTTATTGAPAPIDPDAVDALAPAASTPLAPAADEPRGLPFDPPPAAPDRATPAPRANPLDRSQPSARRRAARGSEPAAPAINLREELDVLQRVQAALRRGDAALALHELEAHRTADSTLLAERLAARILALCQLGRSADARREAAVFAEQHPDSLQRAAVDGSCTNR